MKFDSYASIAPPSSEGANRAHTRSPTVAARAKSSVRVARPTKRTQRAGDHGFFSPRNPVPAAALTSTAVWGATR